MIFFEKHGVDQKELFRFFPLKNYNFPLHFHRAYELIYINDGHLSVSVDQKEYLLQKNDLAFIFTNQMHEFKTVEYSDITIILFSPELIGDFYMNFKGFIPNDNVLHLERELNLKNACSIYEQKSFLYAVCADLINQKQFIPVKQSHKIRVLYKILLYIEQNYSVNCTLKAIAKYLQYDYSYISKLFVKLMNMTFTDYLNNYRISQACYLLKNFHQPIGEVAINCGYDSLRTFHRNFRKIMGQSPGTFLKETQKKV
ncbi:AraC family transcriptional regulator [Anaerobacterium chartisolvens]|uniref:AraC family transcriptional regulator n=1 Tax=Anaerobacterium chartisolvens TaxID=1297424 RepID=A0A369AXN6_9FIRM|nr:response regulator transcription factor [Anaerobacterium chartisolvens]RCX12194.1 AraC family transcriptional regulator [Anaerobacterium chartisolvens]